MNNHRRERRDLIKKRNAQIRTEFWTRYEQLEGRHHAKVDVVCSTMSQIYFLSSNWIKRIVEEVN